MRTLAPLALVLALACNNDDPDVDPDNASTIEGQVSNDAGTQGRLAGSGSVDAAAEVEAIAMSGDEMGQVIGAADIDADGSFAVDVPAESSQMVLVALDENGEKVGSVIVEGAAEAGSTVTSQPIDSETSLEAEAFTWIANERSGETIDTIDLRKRIDADLAAEIDAVADADETRGDVAIDAVAKAVLAAQEARGDVFADAGLSVDAEDLWTAKVSVMSTFVTNVASGATGEATTTTFLDASLDSEAAAGVDAETASTAEHQASLAFRTVIEGALEGVSETEAAIDAGARSAATLEAWAMDEALVTLGSDAAFDAGAQAQFETAGTTLKADVRAASSSSDVMAAFEDYEAVVLDAESGPLTSLVLDVPIVDLSVFVQEVLDAEIDFEAELDSEIASLYASGDVEASAVADTVAQVWASFESDIMAAVEAAPLGNADLAASVVIEASSGFANAGS